MAQHQVLDSVFAALADPTRRAVLHQFGEGPASVGTLAAHHQMALPSLMKRLRLLEDAGWIRTRKEWRVRTCTLETESFSVVDLLGSPNNAASGGRTDRLEHFVAGHDQPHNPTAPTVAGTTSKEKNH